jgi:hypothetical protein
MDLFIFLWIRKYLTRLPKNELRNFFGQWDRTFLFPQKKVGKENSSLFTVSFFPLLRNDLVGDLPGSLPQGARFSIRFNHCTIKGDS